MLVGHGWHVRATKRCLRTFPGRHHPTNFRSFVEFALTQHLAIDVCLQWESIADRAVG